MATRQQAEIALALSVWVNVVACGDNAAPVSNVERDSGTIASEAGVRDLDAGNGSAQTATDRGSASDSGTGTSTSNDAGTTSALDSSVSSASDAALVDAASDANLSSDAASSAGTFTLTSPALSNAAGCSKEMPAPCKVFPEENVSYMKNAASESENLSPELNWSGAPAGTKSFAIVLQDLTNGMAHWVLWNIPGSATKLDKNVPKGSAMPATPAGSQQCNANFAAGDGYFGPGSRCNVYELVVYALSTPMFSPSPATDAGQVRTQLQALGAGILGSASLRGRANYMMMCTN